eukprot:12522277-Alexandrium_andersonii.AAC.1
MHLRPSEDGRPATSVQRLAHGAYCGKCETAVQVWLAPSWFWRRRACPAKGSTRLKIARQR